MTSDPRMPIGRLRVGFFVSSEAVETASKPMYAKNTIEAPEKMPFHPFGAKPCHGDAAPAGAQLPKSKKRSPTHTKNARMTSLIATITVLKRDDSFTPTTSSHVIATT